MSTPTATAEQLDELRRLERMASQAHADATKAMAKMTDAQGRVSMAGADADEFFAAESLHKSLADRVAQLKAATGIADSTIGANGRGPLPIPGGDSRRQSMVRAAERLALNPDLARQPQGALALGANIVDAALARPHGYRAALDGGSLGTRVYSPTFVNDLPRRRLSILDFIPLVEQVEELGGVSLQYFRVDTRTNSAAVVAAGGEKPESVLTVSRQSTTLFKFAHISEAVPLEFLVGKSTSWQSMGLDQFIEQDMAMSVMEAFEDDVLSGDGSSKPDGITHISGTSSTASTGDPIADLRRAIGTLNASNIEPDLIAVSIADAQTLDLETDGMGNYILGGPLAPDTPRLWRLPVIPTSGLSTGTAIVGAFRAGLQRWSGLSMLSWDKINTDHQYNQLRLVAEAGCAAAVTRPACFNLVTIA